MKNGRTTEYLRRPGAHLAVMAALLAIGASAGAATATGPMAVSATVSASCVVGASTLAFPATTSAALLAGAVTATGNVSVNCTTGSAYAVALSSGLGTGATLANRVMTSGTDHLNYSVYTSAALTSVWGDGTAGSQTVAGTGSGVAQSISAYGAIFTGQVGKAETYLDTITVTVTY
jgi:spore coat protein U-like protein